MPSSSRDVLRGVVWQAEAADAIAAEPTSVSPVMEGKEMAGAMAAMEPAPAVMA